jgi:hypothetical protein
MTPIERLTKIKTVSLVSNMVIPITNRSGTKQIGKLKRSLTEYERKKISYAKKLWLKTSGAGPSFRVINCPPASVAIGTGWRVGKLRR